MNKKTRVARKKHKKAVERRKAKRRTQRSAKGTA
jgi:RNase P protein component